MKPSTEQDYHRRIVRTLVYIQEHLDDALTMEELASVAAFSSNSASTNLSSVIGPLALQVEVCNSTLAD